MTAQWLRLRSEQKPSSTGTYVNLSNGARLGVREYARNGAKWEVWMKQAGLNAETLGDGYATEADALSALDDLMAETDFRQLQPPVTEEEIAPDVADEKEEEVK